MTAPATYVPRHSADPVVRGAAALDAIEAEHAALLADAERVTAAADRVVTRLLTPEFEQAS